MPNFQPNKQNLSDLTTSLTVLKALADSLEDQLREALPSALSIIYATPQTKTDKNIDLVNKSTGALSILETISGYAETLNQLITYRIN